MARRCGSAMALNTSEVVAARGTPQIIFQCRHMSTAARKRLRNRFHGTHPHDWGSGLTGLIVSNNLPLVITYEHNPWTALGDGTRRRRKRMQLGSCADLGSASALRARPPALIWSTACSTTTARRPLRCAEFSTRNRAGRAFSTRSRRAPRPHEPRWFHTTKGLANIETRKSLSAAGRGGHEWARRRRACRYARTPSRCCATRGRA
jgi:hypothetical protein